MTKRQGVAFDANGWPNLTHRQVDRVHKWARDLALHGATRRAAPPPFLLACALCELVRVSAALHTRLHAFIEGSARAVPARDVARVAVALLARMEALPDDKARDRYLSMLLGDDDDDDDTTTPVATPTKAH